MSSCALRNYVLLPVAIAVFASLSQAQTGGAVTRIEETDKSITYAGNWYTNGGTLNSGGGAALTNAVGATAVVTFTGTGITWIGVLDPWAGMAIVYLDGTRNTVDTYGGSTLYQQPLFTVTGLSNGPHRLSIEVTHMRDANGLGSWVWIDAFDVENGSGVTGGVTATTGLTEQNNPALTYTGVWFPNSSAVHSGGSTVLATDAGSRATINFTGTGITWIGYRDEWSGIARVYVDGLLNATVDTYLSPAQAQATTYLADGLVPGKHTLTIEVTGTHNPGSGGSWIWVDAFDVVGSTSQAVLVSSAELILGAGRAFQTFVVTFSDPAGPQNFAVAEVLINQALDGRHACHIGLVTSGASSGSVFLMDDAGGTGGPDSAMLLPGSSSVSNSQCSINATGSSVLSDGNTLTLTLAITFMQEFAGNQIFFRAAHSNTMNSSWQTVGTVIVPNGG